jgi:hypothetical protein
LILEKNYLIVRAVESIRTKTTKTKKGTKSNKGSARKRTNNMKLVSPTGLRYEVTKIRAT